ncbi:MAG: flavodoxin family protein [Bacillota bacterium]
MLKITIIYDTRGGNTEKMAEAVEEGINQVEGIESVVKKIDRAEPEDLLESEGLIIGSPTHCGLLSWKLKKFFDNITGEAWGEVKGKIGAAFSTSGGLGGGNEMTLLSILNLLMNYGYLVFGLPDYAASGITAHYGAVAVGEPDQNELESCKILGKQTAEYVKKMWE